MNKELSANTTLSHYRIVRKLGAGGMGEVWLAEDTRLNRRVAIKLLAAEFSQNADRLHRFTREAQAASALNHPNILTIHEIGEINGTHFIATEFIDGQTLSEYAKTNPLTYQSVLEIAIQVASALEDAHQAGIIHRDIKPDNVMVRANGLVKILDFGIAKLSVVNTRPHPDEEAATAIQSTSPGMVIGTANYMSPEQATGREVDARSDIFSFGVVLYEMLAGRSPFAGDNAVEMISAILKDEPEPLPAGVPAGLQRIVAKCLAKDRAERYQTIRDVGNDLKEAKQDVELGNRIGHRLEEKAEERQTQMLPATAADESNRTTKQTVVTKAKAKYVAVGLLSMVLAAGGFFGYRYLSPANQPIESIAVLPFVNESGDAEVEYLSDGMTETLISSLSQLPKLKVKARSSVFRYKGKETDAKTVGKELGVQAVLNGRVTQRSGQVTLRLELVDARTEDVIWSDKYDRRQADLVTLQSDIARDVSSKLKTKLSGAETAKVERTYTDNNEAYQLYLKGRYFSRQFTLEGFTRSVEAYHQAIALDPNYALAYAGLSDAYFYASTIHLPPLEALPKAEVYARQALAHDDSLAAAHHSIANLKSNYEHDFGGAAREFERSIELDPSEPFTHLDYAWLLSSLCDFERAIAMSERAQQLDPLSEQIAAFVGGLYVMARRNDQAIEQLQAALKLDERNWWSHYWLGVTYNQKGMFDRSVESFQTAAKLDNAPMIRGALAHALSRAGRKAEAQRIVDGLLEESKSHYVTPAALVVAYSGFGDREKAFVWLEKSYASHDEGIMFIKSHPMFEPLRDDPRYKGMLKRLGLPE